jgi:hypothetical protein
LIQIFINFIEIIIFMKMTTIAVPQEAKEELTKVAAELQSKTGKRVDLGEAVHALLHERRRRAELLRKACEPLPKPHEALKLLRQERRADERSSERKFGL